MSVQRMPVAFVGHGNPMNAIEDNRFNQSWRALGERLPEPKAILCVSAHWETEKPMVTAAAQPETIHDFSGFPQALFDQRYPAAGSPELAQRIALLLWDEGCELDHSRGLDHGVWSVLLPMFPKADIPVVQLSLASRKSPAWHYEVARKLAVLRDEGVLILASGNIVHNLSLFDRSSAEPEAYDWAQAFDSAICQCLEQGNDKQVINYLEFSGHAHLSVPTPEHYLPVIYAAAQRQANEEIQFFNVETLSSISMSSFVMGGEH